MVCQKAELIAMPSKKASQEAFVYAWFKKNPNRPIPHSESKPAIEASYKSEFGERIEDSDRAIRKLGQAGKLIKERKGVYRYDPSRRSTTKPANLDFDDATRRKVLQRDGYRCVVCGVGAADGANLQVDHRVPRDKGGKGTLANGQTLCSSHNYIKKNIGQYEFSERLFTNWRDTLKKIRKRDAEQVRLLAFCEDVLKLYRKHRLKY